MVNKIIKKYFWLYLISLTSLMSISLCLFRMYNTGNNNYSFLIWNLFLALIPFMVSDFLLKTYKKFDSNFYNFTMFFMWLLFLPNSPYIITDIIHLIDMRMYMPVWYDLMLLVSFSFSGMFIGLVSTYQIHSFLAGKYSILKSWIFIIISIILSSFGVYLGRYQRWNSWDLFTDPLKFFQVMIDKFSEPLAIFTSLGVTFLFSVFTLITYYIFRSMLNYQVIESNNDLKS